MWSTVWNSEYRPALLGYISKGYGNGARRHMMAKIDAVVRTCVARGDRDEVISCKVAAIVNQSPAARSQPPSRVRPADSDNAQDSRRARDRFSAFAHLTHRLDLRVTSYVDYGCGACDLTKLIGEWVGAKHIYGVDLVCPTSLDKSVNFLTDVRSLEDGSVQLMTAFMSLHHISDVDEVLVEIARVIAPGGVFIIREHNSDGTPALHAFLDAIHAYIGAHTGSDSGPAVYRSAREWTRMICKVGFQPYRTFKYDGNNPQKIYFASYIKTKK